MEARHITATIALAATVACSRGQVTVHATTGVQPVERRQQLFVLPPGFQGPVLVIYDQPNGERPKPVNGEIVYNVPKDGIVRTALPEEVLAGAKLRFVYESSSALPQYHNCTQMRMRGLATDPAGVCWLAIQVGATGMPDHAVYIVTDWVGIPENYDRGARMLDSLFFGPTRSSKFKWEEPKAPAAQRST
jgi:hypothetical protein